jgi:phosphoglycolate phosphatase
VLLVFDFDGTLMDTLHDLAESAGDLAETYGGRRLGDAAVAWMIGDGAPILVERVLASAGVLAPQPEALARFLAIYARRALDHAALYPGVLDMLLALAPFHDLVLLTNKPEASTRALMTHTGIAGFFSDGVYGDSEPPRKPDPAGLRWLMTRRRAGAANTLMIGDSQTDLEVARAAGVRLCLARYGFGFMKVPPGCIEPGDLVIDHPAELTAAVDAMRPRPPESSDPGRCRV